jgi:hypothetical protein
MFSKIVTYAMIGAFACGLVATAIGTADVVLGN